MGDLVFLLDLPKSSARGQIIDLNVLFRHLNSDSLFERIAARATTPCSAEAVARAFHFPGLRSAVACANTSSDVSGFTRWYSRRLHSSLQVDTRPAAFDAFRSEMGNAFSLAQPLTRPGASPLPDRSVGQAARPASVAHGGRLGWFPALRRAARNDAPNRTTGTSQREPRSPRATLTASTSGSSVSGSDQLIQSAQPHIIRRADPWSFGPSYQEAHLDPIPPIVRRFAIPGPGDAPTGNEFDLDPPESLCPNPSSPMGS